MKGEKGQSAQICQDHGDVPRIDSKINYLTKINYRMRARSGRPKDDVGMPVLSSWLELRVPMITDDIHELGFDITCGRHGLKTEGSIPLFRINDMWFGVVILCCLLFV
jgi:hypothetical protein